MLSTNTLLARRLLLLLEMGRTQILRALVRRTRATADLAPLATAARPAKAVRHSDRSAVCVRTRRATAMRPAHATRLGAVDAVGHFALDTSAMAPALACVLGAARAAVDNAVLALGARGTGSVAFACIIQ